MSLEVDHRKRFLTLDALRGVAAISILVFHSPLYFLVPSEYLAIDFFFVLSGFVIAHSYEERLLQGMSAWEFAKRRFIRLYPLILLGSIFGLSRPLWLVATQPELRYLGGEMVRLFVFSATLIPNVFYPASAHILYPVDTTTSYPLNGVMWSLFFEFAANIAYAILVKKISNGVLLAIIGISIVWFFQVGVGGNTYQNFSFAFPGVGLCFFSGVLLYRFYDRGFLPSLRLPGFLLVFFLVSILMIPSPKYDVLHPVSHYQLISITLVMPFVVFLGANSKLTAHEMRVGAFLGELSYPIYLLQYPVLIWTRAIIYENNIFFTSPYRDSVETFIALTVTCFLAYIAFRYYDEPCRRRLARIMIRSGLTVSANGGEDSIPGSREATVGEAEAT